jgi:hypothetical protein
VLVGDGEADVVVGVRIWRVVVGGVSVKVGVMWVDEELLTGVDRVDVTLVTDDETVTSVVCVSDCSLPHETTYNIDAATAKTTVGGAPPFADLRADALIEITSTPRRRIVQADRPIEAVSFRENH